MQWSARAVCTAFRDELEAARTVLTLQPGIASSQHSGLLKTFTRCEQLASLEVIGCTHIPGLLELPRLKSLVYMATQGVGDVGTLGSGDSLQHLDLSGWSRRFESIGALATCRSLVFLDLSGCGQLTVDVAALAASSYSLATLHVGKCHHVFNLGALSSCKQLTSLHMSNCFGDAYPPMRDLSFLAPSCRPWLTSLGLGGCRDLADVSVLVACPSLTFVDLSCCSALADIRALASSLSSLRYVDVRGSRASLAVIIPGNVDSVRQGYYLRPRLV